MNTKFKTFALALGLLSITTSLKAQMAADISEEPKPVKKVSIFEKPSEWYIKNWPANYPLTHKLSQNGKFSWQNSKGVAVGEIEIKAGAPTNGITYIQGASDYRMVQRYDKSKITGQRSYLLKEGQWIVIQNNLFDQALPTPQSKLEGKEQPESESKKCTQ